MTVPLKMIIWTWEKNKSNWQKNISRSPNQTTHFESANFSFVSMLFFVIGVIIASILLNRYGCDVNCNLYVGCRDNKRMMTFLCELVTCICYQVTELYFLLCFLHLNPSSTWNGPQFHPSILTSLVIIWLTQCIYIFVLSLNQDSKIQDSWKHVMSTI